MEFDRTKEPVPPAMHAPYAGHHWLREMSYDGHAMQTICVQWQPSAKKWCHSGNVATGRDLDTRGWQYIEPCPMPNNAVTKKIVTEGSVWTQIMPTESEALESQMHSMLFMQADKHFRKTMTRIQQKEWLAANERDAFFTIDELTIGEVLALLIRFGLPVSVTVGE